MSARYFDGPVYHRHGILEALRDYELEHGQAPTRLEWDTTAAQPTSRTIIRHLGSWNAALRAAGMNPRREQPASCPNVPEARMDCTCLDEPGHGGACVCACGRTPAHLCTEIR